MKNKHSIWNSIVIIFIILINVICFNSCNQTSLEYSGPDAPILINPPNESTIIKKPLFNWSEEEHVEEYEIYLTDSVYTMVINEDSLSVSEYVPNRTLLIGKYYWKVRCRDGKGNWGLWSKMWTFTIIQESGELIDIDGNHYTTVKIGNQWWMAENLKVIHFRNGEAIPYVNEDTTWINLTKGALCSYKNDFENELIFGLIYNGYAVIDSRKLAPSGWHIPSEHEWRTLIDFLGGESIAGGKLKSIGTNYWQNPNIGATNESGFSALPGGNRDYYNNCQFYTLGTNTSFWSSSNAGLGNALWYFNLSYQDTDIDREASRIQSGFYIRLVKD
jgi:uncharacterized protein (TIGR02145 family)